MWRPIQAMSQAERGDVTDRELARHCRCITFLLAEDGNHGRAGPGGVLTEWATGGVGHQPTWAPTAAWAHEGRPVAQHRARARRRGTSTARTARATAMRPLPRGLGKMRPKLDQMLASRFVLKRLEIKIGCSSSRAACPCTLVH